MPTIIDSFLVEFGIDPKKYQAGSDEIRRQNKRTREEGSKADKEMQAGAKRNAEALGKVKNEVTGLFLAFAGASTIKSFISDLIHGDAATGRLAANLGVATSELSAWQLMAKQAGGGANDADTAFRKLAGAAADLRLTGESSISGDLKAFNIGLDDLAKPSQALIKMAEAGERMDRVIFFQRLTRMGIPESLITTLAKGGKATRELVDQMERQAALQKTNADSAAKLEGELALLEGRIKDGVRPALYTVVDGLLKITNNTDAMNAVLPAAVGLVGALAVEAIALAAPFLLTAAAIGAVVYGLKKLTDQEKSQPQGQRSRGWLDSLSHWWNTGELPNAASKSSPKPGSPAAAAGTPVTGSDADYLRKAGLSDAQTKGVLAGIKAEGGGLGMASNGAFGIGQWRGPRLAALRKRYGAAPTRQEQLEFLVDELKGGDRGGKAVMAQSTAAGALEEYIRAFMRPGNRNGGRDGPGVDGDLKRGYAALGIARPGVTATGATSRSSTSSTTIGTLVIQTAATDANGIARELPGAIERRMTTASANRGLD